MIEANAIYCSHYHRILIVSIDERMVKCVMTPIYDGEPPRIALIPIGHVESHVARGFWKFENMKP